MKYMLCDNIHKFCGKLWEIRVFNRINVLKKRGFISLCIKLVHRTRERGRSNQ